MLGRAAGLGRRTARLPEVRTGARVAKERPGQMLKAETPLADTGWCVQSLRAAGMLHLSGSGRGLGDAQNRLPAGDIWRQHSERLAEMQDSKAPLAAADTPAVNQSPCVSLQLPRPHRPGDSRGQGWHHGQQQSPTAGSAHDDGGLNLTSSALKKSHGLAGDGAQWPPAGCVCVCNSCSHSTVSQHSSLFYRKYPNVGDGCLCHQDPH